MGDRQNHVEWCKTRAREYLKTGDLNSAVTSMISDMNKRDDCFVSPALSALGMMSLMQNDPRGVERFIEGFN